MTKVKMIGLTVKTSSKGRLMYINLNHLMTVEPLDQPDANGANTHISLSSDSWYPVEETVETIMAMTK
jgi:hypothetical protein